MTNTKQHLIAHQQNLVEHLQLLHCTIQSWLQRLVPRPFDWVLLFLYSAVLLNFIIFSCVCVLSWPKIIGMTSAILTMLFLDRWEQSRLGTAPRRRTAVGLFLLRVALIELIAQIDQFDVSSFLYVLLPYIAVLLLGYTAGWGIGALIWLRYMYELVSNGNGAGWDNLRIRNDDVIVFSLGIVFVLTMAKLVLQERAGRARTEKLLGELEQSHQQLTVYAHQVAELATVSERNRLARDIHDSLGHYLTVINVQLEKALAFRTKEPHTADRAVEDSKRLAREALDDVRRSVGLLRTHQGLFSLHHALQTLVEQTRSEQLHISFHMDGAEDGFSNQALMALYRVAQEGLTNVQRHAQAQCATITLELTADAARLSIRDDGIGFDAATRPCPGSSLGGYGLHGVQERLALVAGTVQILTEPEHGTELVVVVPRDPVSRSIPALVAGSGVGA